MINSWLNVVKTTSFEKSTTEVMNRDFDNFNENQDEYDVPAASNVEEICENKKSSAFDLKKIQKMHNDFRVNDLKNSDIENSANKEFIEIYVSILTKSTENNFVDISTCSVQHQTFDFEMIFDLWAEKENIKKKRTKIF